MEDPKFSDASVNIATVIDAQRWTQTDVYSRGGNAYRAPSVHSVATDRQQVFVRYEDGREEHFDERDLADLGVRAGSRLLIVSARERDGEPMKVIYSENLDTKSYLPLEKSLPTTSLPLVGVLGRTFAAAITAFAIVLAYAGWVSYYFDKSAKYDPQRVTADANARLESCPPGKIFLPVLPDKTFVGCKGGYSFKDGDKYLCKCDREQVVLSDAENRENARIASAKHTESVFLLGRTKDGLAAIIACVVAIITLVRFNSRYKDKYRDKAWANREAMINFLVAEGKAKGVTLEVPDLENLVMQRVGA